MTVRIITSCTGEKQHAPANQLTLDDFKQGQAHVRMREKDLRAFQLSARDMYTGQQHVRLLRGIDAVQNSISTELFILSAGYGLIPSSTMIAPYEATFAIMTDREIKRWGEELGVPGATRKTLAEPCDLGFILLGDDYLKACRFDSDIVLGGPTILFCGKIAAKRIPRIPNLRIVTLSNAEAKRFSCGLIALKGELGARLLKQLEEDPDLIQKLRDPATDVLSLLENPEQHLEKKRREKATANPNVDYVISIPTSWWDKPHKKKLRYFIPEWDDLVDPEYNFISDGHSGGSGDWSNEVYAHQMYPDPNYDGILMSRAVAEKNKKKDARINTLGVHRFLRVPRAFPIMGDCGAFDYIDKKDPPYSTEDVLDYYTRLDFDFGVSVDHLIVPAFYSEKEYRYELTIRNAEDFLRSHQKAGLSWEPIGAVQGWDASSYAAAAEKYVRMGYRSIGLGGLVRCSSGEITTILRKVQSVIPKDMNVHLFGIARPEVLNSFSSLGVTSVDSASPLRRAWLSSKGNYYALNGESFSALRIPGVGKSFRAKRIIQTGSVSDTDLAHLEQRCLKAVRDVDLGARDLSTAIDALTEYSRLINGDGPDMREEYRRTLTVKPWKECPCDICRKWGVEVIIFRGNNRNRRRGFHNTYVFYRLMQQALEGKEFVQESGLQLGLFQQAKEKD